jgi:hypothetical protein
LTRLGCAAPSPTTEPSPGAIPAHFTTRHFPPRRDVPAPFEAARPHRGSHCPKSVNAIAIKDAIEEMKRIKRMAKFLKTVSAGILLCAVSWNGQALGQGLTQPSKDIVDMNVSVICKNGDATFTVTNTGEAWPGVGNLSVYSVGVATPIHQRRMRFNKGQRVTFRVPGVAAENIEFGLWVDPSWFKRDLIYDAKITCS